MWSTIVYESSVATLKESLVNVLFLQNFHEQVALPSIIYLLSIAVNSFNDKYQISVFTENQHMC